MMSMLPKFIKNFDAQVIVMHVKFFSCENEWVSCLMVLFLFTLNNEMQPSYFFHYF